MKIQPDKSGLVEGFKHETVARNWALRRPKLGSGPFEVTSVRNTGIWVDGPPS